MVADTIAAMMAMTISSRFPEMILERSASGRSNVKGRLGEATVTVTLYLTPF